MRGLSPRAGHTSPHGTESRGTRKNSLLNAGRAARRLPTSSMSSLLSEVVPLALGAAISPVLFLLQLNALTGARPIARGSALTAGAAVVLIVASTIGVLIGDTGFSTKDTLQAAINIASVRC